MTTSDSPVRAGPTESARKKAAQARSRREALIDLIYIAPQYIIYIGLQLLPFAIALPIIFTDQVDFLDQNVDWVGFDNIAALFQAPLDDRLYDALRRTVIFSVVNYCMVFLFGFILALAMFEVVSKMKGIFFTIIYMPWMLSGIGVGLIMVMLFSTDTGSFNLMLSEVGLGKNSFDAKSETTALFVLPFMYGWKAAGFNMALFLGGLLAIPTETIESARMDGARYWQRVWYIYLPQIVPSIIIATIFSIINSFGIFDELVGIGALAGNQNAEFMSIFIYQLGFGSATVGGAKIGTLAQGITASLVIFLPLVFLAFWLNLLQKKMSYH